MTRRAAKWQLTHGYAVIAIPDDGLFIRAGRLESGRGKPVEASELILFSRRVDADQHADQQVRKWAGGADGHEWFFPVIPVLVNERM